MNTVTIKKDNFDIHFICEITEYLDTITQKVIYAPKTCCNYLYTDSPRDNRYAIRFPGATRGHIKVDKDGIIIEVKIYEDTCHIYKMKLDKLNELLNEKFVGCKIISDVMSTC